MKKLIPITVIISLLPLFSCSEKQENEHEIVYQEGTDLIKENQLLDSIRRTQRQDSTKSKYLKPIITHIHQGQLTTFKPWSYLYKSLENDSIPFDSIPFGTELRKGKAKYHRELQNVIYQDDSCFISKNDLSWNNYSSPDGHHKYYFIQNDSARVIIKVLTDDLSITSIYSTKNHWYGYVSNYNASLWNGVDLLFSLDHVGECCGCSDGQDYFLDNGDSIFHFIHTTQFIEDYDYEEEAPIEAGLDESMSLPTDPLKDSLIFRHEPYGYEDNYDSTIIKKFIFSDKVIKQVSEEVWHPK